MRRVNGLGQTGRTCCAGRNGDERIRRVERVGREPSTSSTGLSCSRRRRRGQQHRRRRRWHPAGHDQRHGRAADGQRGRSARRSPPTRRSVPRPASEPAGPMTITTGDGADQHLVGATTAGSNVRCAAPRSTPAPGDDSVGVGSSSNFVRRGVRRRGRRHHRRSTPNGASSALRSCTAVPANDKFYPAVQFRGPGLRRRGRRPDGAATARHFGFRRQLATALYRF